MTNIRFSKTGEKDGEPTYTLYVGGNLIEKDIPLGEVVRRINEFEETDNELPRL